MGSGAGVEGLEVEGTGAGVEDDGGGVIKLSIGSRLAELSKSDGYISPGAERKDSAGESSNLTEGGAWEVSWDAILMETPIVRVYTFI